MPDLIREQEGFDVFPAHRLDKTTGGVFLLARSSCICGQLQRLFQNNSVEKEYLAVVSGVPEEHTGSFSDLLYHDQRTNKTFVVNKQRKGVKESSCDWHVIDISEHNNSTETKMSLIRICLHSGRTHQIRVQFASRKLPLVGDRRYGSHISASVPALWSTRIAFQHPVISGKIIDVSSEPPDFFPWSSFAKPKKRCISTAAPEKESTV